MSNLVYLLYAIGFFAFLILAEFLYGIYIKNNTYKNLKDAATSLSLGILSVVLQVLVGAYMLQIDLGIFKYRLFNIDYQWYNVILCYLCMDLTYYWWHRASHRVRFLWANHINHHTSEEFNFTTALRQPFFVPILRPLFYLHLPLIGFDPKLIGILGSVGLLSAVWTHTKLIGKLGFLEKIIVTPSGHRVHHGSNPEYIDKNYGGTFMFWDVLFGTYEPEVNEIKYGITNNIKTYNPIKIIFHEWLSWGKDILKSKSLSSAIKFTMYGPDAIEGIRELNSKKQ